MRPSPAMLLTFFLLHSFLSYCSFLRRAIPLLRSASSKPLTLNRTLSTIPLKQTPTEIYNSQFKKQIENQFSGALNSEIIKNCIKGEKKFPDHVAIYHGRSDTVEKLSGVSNAFYCSIVKKLLGKPIKLENFTHLKPLGTPPEKRTIDKFINEEYEIKFLDQGKDIKNHFDHLLEKVLLSGNLTPLANWENLEESTFARYKHEKSTSRLKPLSDTVASLLTEFNFDQKYSTPIVENIKKNKSERGHINQILIPDALVPDMLYLSKSYGAPFSKTHGPIYGPYSPETTLKTLREYNADPKSMPLLNYYGSPTIDQLQARVLYTPEMTNPKSGVKIFTHGEKFPADEDELSGITDEAVNEIFKTDKGTKAFYQLIDQIKEQHKD